MVQRVEISGMGAGYEDACQIMLSRFLDWGKDKAYEEIWAGDKDDIIMSSFAEAELTELVKDLDVTGAMWGATLGHFWYIKGNGYDKWLEEGKIVKEWDENTVLKQMTPQEAFEAGKKAAHDNEEL